MDIIIINLIISKGEIIEIAESLVTKRLIYRLASSHPVYISIASL